jgi:hypothetical protein
LQESYITKMVEGGLLEMRYPETRNHPDQSYRTTPSADSEVLP